MVQKRVRSIMDASEKAVSLLQNNPIFSSARGHTVRKAIESGNIKSFQKGELVFSRQSGEKLLGMIVEGSASVLKDRLVISTLLPGDVFGAVTLFSSEEGFLNDVEAAGRCSVLFMGGQTVRRIISEEPAVAQSYIAYLSERIYFLNRRIEAFTAGRAEEKLFVFITANVGEDGVCRIKSYSELAKKLDIGRATLYRSLDILEESGKIKREGKAIRLISR